MTPERGEWSTLHPFRPCR